MKKIFTLRSILAAVLFIFNSTVFAQWPFAGFCEDGREPQASIGVSAIFGQSTNLSLPCAGESLTADVKFNLKSSCGRDVITPTSITLSKDDLLAKKATLDFAYTYYKDGNNIHTITVTLQSVGSDDFDGIELSITAVGKVAPYVGLDNLITAVKASEDEMLPEIATVTGDFVVTHIFNSVHNAPLCYMQDDAYGVVYDNSKAKCKVGEHYNQLSGWAQRRGSEYIIQYETYLAEELGKPTRTEVATPTLITIDQVAAHHGRLVQIDAVQFGETGAFAECDTVAVTIGDQAAQICLFPGSDLVGESIPSRAKVTGILRSVESGKIVLAPRSKADIIAIEEETTALEQVTAEVQVTKIIENGQVYIIRDGVRYNVLGAKQ